MSWDIFAFKVKDYPPQSEVKPEDRIPLGTMVQVREQVERHLEVEWGGHFWCYYYGEGFTLEINIGSWDSEDDEVIDSVSIEVRGGGDPIPTLLQLAAANRWALLDLATGQLIDPQAPSDAGWKAFQAARDQMVEDVRTRYGVVL